MVKRYFTARRTKKVRKMINRAVRGAYKAAQSKTLGRLMRRPVYHFKRNFEIAPTTHPSFVGNIPTQLTNVGLAYNFYMSLLPNWGEFAALFDRYRINKVVLRLIPQITSSVRDYADNANLTGAGTNIGRNPRVLSVVDYDDSSVPASANIIREYSKCRVDMVVRQKPIVYKITPALLTEAYEGVASTAYMPKWKQWVDFADVDTPHYGLKIWVEDCAGITNATNSQIFKVEGTMYFSCKDVR